MYDKISKITTALRQEKPLIVNITNDVTMDFIANGLLSIGASPVMSKSKKDLDDLIPLAKTVVINIGTLDTNFIALCEHACQLANQHNKPIILDPVGAGASRYRTEAAKNILDNYQIAIIRGNASEIMALADLPVITKGVDSTAASHQAVQSAEMLASKYNATVVVSGKQDVIVDSSRTQDFERGSAMMPAVVGCGCLLSSVVGAFHAVEPDPFVASAAATLFYSVCGERAAEQAQGPGSFKTYFLDSLHAMPLGEHYE